MINDAIGGSKAEPTTRERDSDWKERVLQLTWRFGSLALLMVAFTILSSNFLSQANWIDTSEYGSTILILALGETLVIITAGIDLSVGAMAGVASSVAALVLQNTSGSIEQIALACAAGIAIAGVMGVINGVIIAVLDITPFIATLGMLGVGSGVTLLLTNGEGIQVPNSVFPLGNGIWLHWIPVVVAVAIVLCFLVDHVLRRTPFGTHTRAIGSDREAARRSGVGVTRTLIGIYTASGMLAGVAGVLLMASNVSGSPTAGQDMELDAIAAVVIGGTSLFGGTGSVLGTVVGTAVVAIIETGLVLVGVSPNWQTVTIGVVIVLSVFVQQVISGQFKTRLQSLTASIRRKR